MQQSKVTVLVYLLYIRNRFLVFGSFCIFSLVVSFSIFRFSVLIITFVSVIFVLKITHKQRLGVKINEETTRRVRNQTRKIRPFIMMSEAPLSSSAAPSTSSQTAAAAAPAVTKQPQQQQQRAQPQRRHSLPAPTPAAAAEATYKGRKPGQNHPAVKPVASPHKLGKGAGGSADPHPAAIPESHRDDRLAQVVEKFAAELSPAQKLAAKHPVDTKVRQKGKAVAGDAFSQVSPHRETLRDARLDRENDKFAHHDGIIQKVGEKDLAHPALAQGKAKSVVIRELSPEQAAQARSREQQLDAEVERLARMEGGALAKIGEHDHPLKDRRAVVSGRGPLGSRKSTSELLNPDPAPFVVFKRSMKTGSVMEQYEKVIAERTAARIEAQDAQAAACDFLSNFNEPEAKPYHPSLKQVPHDEYNSSGSAAATISGASPQPAHGSTGLGNSHARKRGARDSILVSDRDGILAAGAKVKYQQGGIGLGTSTSAVADDKKRVERFTRTLNSSSVMDCLVHPDTRIFSPHESKHTTVVHVQRKAVKDSVDAPVWWNTMSSQRQRLMESGGDAAQAQSQLKNPPPRPATGRRPPPAGSVPAPDWWPAQQQKK